ncbi:MAG: hypothetical protein EBY17_29180, partial [Acidobacteriia bacterium]|nr:hypothetical protein [Terriglobia bacterium]
MCSRISVDRSPPAPPATFVGACPVCRQPYLDRFDKQKVQYGRWVHRRCVPAEERRVALLREQAERSTPWYPLDGVGDALAAPQLASVERVQGGSYTKNDIVRLLSRVDEQGFPLVQRMFDRMLERQTEDERRANRTRIDNSRGFSQPDARKAGEMLRELRERGYSRFLHMRMSALLMNYINTQLPEIMSAGAERTGVAMRTNPKTQRLHSTLLTRAALDEFGAAFVAGRHPATPEAAVLWDAIEAGWDREEPPRLPVSLPTLKRRGLLHRWIVRDACESARSVPQKESGEVAIRAAEAWVADPSEEN